MLTSRITISILEKAQLLWDYHHMNHQPHHSDCILVLGSHDLRVAERGAELYLQGYAPLLVFSGGLGNFTKETWTSAEADLFAEIAIQMGVPDNAILRENKSTNTGENILFTRKLLDQHGLNPETFLLVQKPYMERRSYATFKQNWPEKKLLVTSPQISFEDYPNQDIPLEKVINIMVGDLQRIKFYPAKGFQIYQEIPAEVWAACESLISSGFNKHLMKD
ncbi:MAG: YdcF family protein [Chitinophagaceae bacterium]|nr:MAG: YdcF family protein [Chitinophagaceae bacterium]